MPKSKSNGLLKRDKHKAQFGQQINKYKFDKNFKCSTSLKTILSIIYFKKNWYMHIAFCIKINYDYDQVSHLCALIYEKKFPLFLIS